MAGGDAEAEAAAGLVFADAFGQAHADAETLIVRQRDEAADSFAAAAAELGEGGTEGDLAGEGIMEKEKVLGTLMACVRS